MPLDYDYSTVDYIIRRRLHIRGPTNLIAGCANANHLSTVLTSDQTMATRSFNHSYWWTVAVALVWSVINTILSWSSLSGPQCLRKASVMFSKLTWERAYQSSRSPFDDLHFSLKEPLGFCEQHVLFVHRMYSSIYLMVCCLFGTLPSSTYYCSLRLFLIINFFPYTGHTARIFSFIICRYLNFV